MGQVVMNYYICKRVHLNISRTLRSESSAAERVRRGVNSVSTHIHRTSRNFYKRKILSCFEPFSLALLFCRFCSHFLHLFTRFPDFFPLLVPASYHFFLLR